MSRLLTLLRPKAEAFSPLDIDGLQLWLDAADTSTITESSGDVSQWDDKSGNGNHVSQATAVSQPKTGTRTLNGLNTLDFDNSNDFLTGTVPSFSQPNTLFMVFQADSTGNDIHIDGMHRFGFSTNDFALRAGGSYLLSGLGQNTNANVWSAVVNGANSEFRINGGTPAIGNPGTSATSTTVSIGGTAGGGFHIDGRMAEILFYDSALSTADREAVQEYLAAKWNVALV